LWCPVIRVAPLVGAKVIFPLAIFGAIFIAVGPI
jgi:hypothetical protein